MTRRLWSLPYVALLVAALGCSLPGAETPTEQVEIISTPVEAAQPTPAVTETGETLVTVTPQSTGPEITGVAFTSDPQSGSSGLTFPKGVTEIWAVMDYRNMRDGLKIRRVWYKDGTPWIEREETWNFARYGANGQIKDISIYDREVGLPAGHYELEVFIDGQNQFLSTGETRANFDIINGPTGTETFKSPDETKTVLLERPGTLRLDSNVLAQHPEIETVRWFPDNQHLLYVVLDRSEQLHPPATIGLKWELWIVDSAGGQPYRISEGSEHLRDPIISPDGNAIAVGSGSGYCDAGLCDYILRFIRLADFQRTALLSYQEFAGMPGGTPAAISPSMKQGHWNNAVEFVVPMIGSFQAEGFDSGLYRFNLSTLTTEWLGLLP